MFEAIIYLLLYNLHDCTFNLCIKNSAWDQKQVEPRYWQTYSKTTSITLEYEQKVVFLVSIVISEQILQIALMYSAAASATLADI